ncbi:MAG: S4 domain-containing protein, partial [Defluviicoccus sp.]
MSSEAAVLGAFTVAVGSAEAGLRLDRWFKRHYPQVPHALLEKWLRTGQVRLDGKRVTAGVRVEAGQSVRVPPV